MKLILFLTLNLLVLASLAQDPAVLLREAQTLETQMRENEAFQKYTSLLHQQPNNLTVLCKCSELCSRIGHRQAEKSKKIDYYKAARTYAAAALRISPNNSEANFVMALALGRMSQVSSGKEKLAEVREIQHYALVSIKADSTNFKPYHLLGKWNYEVSDLSMAERSLAKWFYGGLPPASLQEAIYYYEKCLALSPHFVLNYLEVAKAYHRNHEDQKAAVLLTKMLSMPDRMPDDEKIKEEGRQLLHKIK